MVVWIFEANFVDVDSYNIFILFCKYSWYIYGLITEIALKNVLV